MTDQTLIKVIEVAKRGIGGEKNSAIRLVKKECEKRGLNFDEAMRGKITTSKWNRGEPDDWTFVRPTPGFTSTAPNPGNFGFGYAPSQSQSDLSRHDLDEMFADLLVAMKAQEQRKQDLKDFFNNQQRATAGYSQTYSTSRGGQLYKDKAGIAWTYEELKNLHATKRLQLFGYDPLYT